jgi:hypothetical protein
MNGHSQPDYTSHNRRIRYGLMRILVGSTHVIVGPDGKHRQFAVLDRARHRSAKCVAVCLGCNRTWATVEELIAAHPSATEMVKSEAKHPYGWWCDELSARAKQALENIDIEEAEAVALEPDDAELSGVDKKAAARRRELRKKEFAKRRAAASDHGHVLGLLADVEP